MKTGFYICIHRNGKTGWIAGPFETEAAAEQMRLRAENEAQEVDCRAAFDWFSIGKLTAACLPPGVLNSRLGL